jgi:hypothetical protein
LNFTPSSTALMSFSSTVPGVTFAPQTEQGQLTLTSEPGDGVSMLPLSSTARDRTVVDGLPCATHE